MQLANLTEEDIRRHTDPQSFRRGYRYYQNGAILDPVRQENELRAECMGSQPLPYSVTVTLDEAGDHHSPSPFDPVYFVDDSNTYSLSVEMSYRLG